ncbi:MAG: diacylglycerol kinase [Proteobacteria bacterium]|nr:diacylglycerol kinase [Pseudomonadota bacterium]
MKNKLLGTGEKGFRPVRKIKIALKGLYLAIVFDVSVSSKVILSTVVLAVFVYVNQWIDFTIVLVATCIMITAEIFNTAIEMLCDFIEEKENEKIGMIKDMLAGGVGLSIFTWYVVIALESYKIYRLLF